MNSVLKKQKQTACIKYLLQQKFVVAVNAVEMGQNIIFEIVILYDLPCDLPCAASLAGIQPVRPRAQRTSP